MTDVAVVFLAVARVPKVGWLYKVILYYYFTVQALPLKLSGIFLKHVLVRAWVDIVIALLDARLGLGAVADNVVLEELLRHEHAAELALGAVGALDLMRLDVSHGVLIATEATHGDFWAPGQMEVIVSFGKFNATEWALDCIRAFRFVVKKLSHLVRLATESAQLSADVPLRIELRLVLIEWAWIIECLWGSGIRMHRIGSAWTWLPWLWLAR